MHWKNNPPVLSTPLFAAVAAIFVLSAKNGESSMTREEFLAAAKGSYTTEMGSFGTTSGDSAEFEAYVLLNWRSILEEMDSLIQLKSDPMHGMSYTLLSLACEDLEPDDYLDYLENLVQALGKRKQNGDNLVNSSDLLLGRGRKHGFLSVNHEHPRVKKILEEAINLFEDINPAAASLFKDQLNGKLDEFYFDGNERPLPETLPGIKLKRPFGTLIKRYEQLTGKKVPPDPDFPEEAQTRPSKRSASASEGPERMFADTDQNSGIPWALVAVAMAGLVALIAVGKSVLRKGR